jgi:hypothetical protein
VIPCSTNLGRLDINISFWIIAYLAITGFAPIIILFPFTQIVDFQ